MSTWAIIPARYGATRLPGKPLLNQTGRSLIQHVVEAVRSARRIDHIVVATDDDRIRQTVESFGCQAVMTRADCRSGTDRLAEAAEQLGLDQDDIIVNVQGDEPEMPARCVDELVALLELSDTPMATLATPLSAESVKDPNRVKVVLDANGLAMYFSRAPIPYDRDGNGNGRYLLHLGIYAYRAGFLRYYASLPATPAEQLERLEQLRVLEHGCTIAVGVTDYHGCGIDTPEDYAAFVARWKSSGQAGPGR